MPEPAPSLATLLVADDDPAVRQSLERALTREGYAVVLAPGRAGRARAAAGRAAWTWSSPTSGCRA